MNKRLALVAFSLLPLAALAHTGHGEHGFLDQVGEHQTCVLIVAVQLHGFQSHLFYQFVSNRERRCCTNAASSIW